MSPLTTSSPGSSSLDLVVLGVVSQDLDSSRPAPGGRRCPASAPGCTAWSSAPARSRSGRSPRRRGDRWPRAPPTAPTAAAAPHRTARAGRVDRLSPRSGSIDHARYIGGAPTMHADLLVADHRQRLDRIEAVERGRRSSRPSRPCRGQSSGRRRGTAAGRAARGRRRRRPAGRSRTSWSRFASSARWLSIAPRGRPDRARGVEQQREVLARRLPLRRRGRASPAARSCSQRHPAASTTIAVLADVAEDSARVRRR